MPAVDNSCSELHSCSRREVAPDRPRRKLGQRLRALPHTYRSELPLPFPHGGRQPHLFSCPTHPPALPGPLRVPTIVQIPFFPLPLPLSGPLAPYPPPSPFQAFTAPFHCPYPPFPTLSPPEQSSSLRPAMQPSRSVACPAPRRRPLPLATHTLPLRALPPPPSAQRPASQAPTPTPPNIPPPLGLRLPLFHPSSPPAPSSSLVRQN